MAEIRDNLATTAPKWSVKLLQVQVDILAHAEGKQFVYREAAEGHYDPFNEKTDGELVVLAECRHPEWLTGAREAHKDVEEVLRNTNR